ncbi:MAG: SprB repeat-containing protein, partial [Bacteroidetes bacterium]|nr:SprB repeat-containing protein [Bacteroidota bacterium]
PTHPPPPKQRPQKSGGGGGGAGALALLLLAVPLFAAAAPPLSVSLTRSNYHGYGVSCFGMKDGTLQAVATGGTAPYHYRWSNGASTAYVDHLAAGYYRLDIKDANGEVATAEITLEQPLPMKLDVDVYEYSNGYNISCYDCNNGNAAVVVLGGAAPFTVSWSDGPVGASRYNLGPKDYKITVADANGCEGANTTIYLRGPAPSNWGMGGNANTTPGAQFMGTTDNKDVVFKSNGQERLRLKADGRIALADTTLYGKELYLRTDGTLDAFGNYPDHPEVLCWPSPIGTGMYPDWRIGGNMFLHPLCNDNYPLLGSKVPLSIGLITNDQERMVITTEGKVGIGTTPPSGQSNYLLFVENGISTRDVLVTHGDWPDYVFADNHPLMAMADLRTFLKQRRHLPGIPSASEVQAQGGVEVGDMQRRLLKTAEEQALYILQLEEKIQRLEQRLGVLEASHQ